MNTKLMMLLKELETFGIENDAHAANRSQKMLNITRDTGEFLAILIRAMKAKRVLEIGTSNGYSTLWLAQAAQTFGGQVTTLELAPHKAKMARTNFERAELLGSIDLRLVDAQEFIHQQPPVSFEFIFLDSDREHYVSWWRDLQRLLAPSGLIVVDNAVSHAKEMESFVQQVQHTNGFITSLVPVGNGEFLILKNADPKT